MNTGGGTSGRNRQNASIISNVGNLFLRNLPTVPRSHGTGRKARSESVSARFSSLMPAT